MKKTPQLIQNDNLESLTKEELILELKTARAETYKYVNKFLEVEEKWAFINFFLKKLNSIRQKNELWTAICDGFIKLTNSKVCACSRFNPDKGEVESKKIAYGKGNIDKSAIEKFTNELDSQCCEFIKNSINTETITNYFDSLSSPERIIIPIDYANTFLGYLLLEKEDENFYKENIYFVKIFPDHIAMILENLSLYEESEKANKRKIEFLAGIAHEFKTPLNSIIGFTEILALKLKSVPRAEYIQNYLNNILRSSQHLLSLIEDILDVSKSQSMNLELNYTQFSPKTEIIQIINTLEAMIKEKDIELTYTLVDINISADIKRFKQLIYNLTSNAIKFNKVGGKISLFTYIKNNKFFFEITDTGDGISKKDYEKIFDFFSQVNRSQLKRQLGSGVGLALCKMITLAHNGEIDFKSQIKKGSSFWFNLPINKESK